MREAQDIDGLKAASTYRRDATVRRIALKALRENVEFREEEVFLEGLQDASPEVRREAAKGLGRVGTRKAIPLLVKALEDRDASVSADVARALGYLNAVEAKEPLARAWSRGNVTAAHALAELGSAEGAEFLCNQLGSPDRVARWEAAMALAALGDSAVEHLLVTFRSGGRLARIAVCWAFEEHPDPRSLGILSNAAQSNDWELRKAAKDALRALQEDVHADER